MFREMIKTNFKSFERTGKTIVILIKEQVFQKIQKTIFLLNKIWKKDSFFSELTVLPNDHLVKKTNEVDGN